MRPMLVAQLLAAIERLAPSALAEEWDNVGLLVGRHNQPARRVLVALELRDEVLDEARETGCDAVLTHHPPIFPALSALTDAGAASELVLRAAEGRVAVIAAHTNLDAAPGGLNDVMAGLLGITAEAALVPSADDPSSGLGRVGPVAPTTLGALVERVRAGFGGASVTYAGDPFARVQRVACCTGSGRLTDRRGPGGRGRRLRHQRPALPRRRPRRGPAARLHAPRPRRAGGHEALDQGARAGPRPRGRRGPLRRGRHRPLAGGVATGAP